MLYDRPYMRHDSGQEFRQTSVVTTLIIVTVAVFVLQQVLNVMFPGADGRGNYFMGEWFALSGQNFRELKVWTVLTYTFLHSTAGFVHILGNMLGLFFIGRIIQPILGNKKFLYLYFGGSLLGGLFYILIHFNSFNPVVGASAAVSAILAFFCLLRPEQPITLLLFFVLPITLKPKYIFWGSIIISVIGALLYELPGQSRIAHSAHLGGLLAGVFYFRFIYSAAPGGFTRSEKPSIEIPDWFKKKRKTVGNFNYRVNRTNRASLQKEVDRILDKINLSGFGSLTDEEKSTLDRAKDILSN